MLTCETEITGCPSCGIMTERLDEFAFVVDALALLIHSFAAMPARYGDMSIPAYRFPTAACMIVPHAIGRCTPH